MFTDDNSFQSQNCSTSRQTFIIESSISPTTFYTFLYSIFNQIHDIAKIKILSDKLKSDISSKERILSIFSITSIHRNEGGKKEIDSIIDTKLFNDVYQRSMGSLKKKKKIQFSVKGRNIDEGTLSSCRLVA